MRFSKKDKELLIDSRISKFQLDSLLNQAVTTSFIHTSYNKADVTFFKQELLKFLDNETFVETGEINQLLDVIAQKSTVNSFNQIKVYSRKGSLADSFVQSLALKNSEVAEVTTKTQAVVNSFIADVQKARVLDTFDKASFVERASIIAKSETSRITNVAVEKVAQKEGFTHWIWGASSSANSRSAHEVLYGKKSKIGESPADGGEFPGELQNCQCKMIYIKDN